MRTLTSLVAVCLSVPAFAGVLNNKDAREYRLHLKTNGGDMTVPLNTVTRVEHTCVAFPCIVENEDTGEKVKLTCRDENLIIKDGHLAVSMTDDASAGGGGSGGVAAPASKPATKSAAKAGKHSKHAAKAGKKKSVVASR
jgi:hypothetical protein